MSEGTPLTSEYLKREVAIFFAGYALENPEDIVISCGVHASMPHHHGSGVIRPHQTIVCDLFPRSRANGYFADMTRTYVKGVPSPEATRMYEAVRAAQAAAFDVIKPGLPTLAAYNASKEVFLKAGFDVGEKGFIHGLGHGYGIEIHEAPSGRVESQDIFEEGHVFTVEPGLYYEAWGGVRLEDTVVVTKDGCENLTNYRCEFVIP